MSENWVSKMWFGAADTGAVAGSTEVVDAGEVAQSGSGAASTKEVSTGSGSLPAIRVAIDYWLRDKNGEVLTDETGEGLSLEGLNA